VLKEKLNISEGNDEDKFDDQQAVITLNFPDDKIIRSIYVET